MGRHYVRAVRKVFTEFCKETSATGFQYLVDSTQTLFERCIWLILQLFLVVAVVLMILHTFEDVLEEPVVTSLETVRYPIEKIQFPGISICNINKISKKRAVQYAKIISQKGNLPFDYILKQIKILGKFYDFETDNMREYLTFQTYLEKYGVINNITDQTYLYHIMKNLSTPCKELLYKCTWKGVVRNCSEIFKLRRTYEGFCCTFNYVRYNTIDISSKDSKEPEHLSTPGWDTGLTVVVQHEPDDYFYPLISSIGLNVHVFDSTDYPDDTSGGLIQELVGIGTETFLDVNAETIYSVPEIQKYPVPIRKCIFPNEVTTIFGAYSLSNCLVECRVKSILALCKCVPFIIPWHTTANPCTLVDIPCLNRYQGKWRSLYPRDYKFDELQQEKQNSLLCDECYAECTDTYYSVSTYSAPLHMGRQKCENFSVIRLYYGQAYTKLYRQDVLYYWFEIISSIGGVLGIFLGISIVSVTEFLYFITFRFISIVKNLKM